MLGVGLGLRAVHYPHILERRPKVPWFEVISENYMGTSAGSGGRGIKILEDLRRDYPLVMHGVSLSIGSKDPIDKSYLKKLKNLASRIDPLWISDHLCWTGVENHNLHDLLPLPYTQETIHHLVERIQQVQDFLGRKILLENVSSYVTYAHSEMTEWECLTEVSTRADCLILLDVNNIHVSAVNHNFKGEDFINGVPKNRVAQFHLAGYSDQGTHLIDTHDHPVSNPVWRLYEKAVARFGGVPTLIEWDDNIPPFERLWKEAKHAEKIQRKILTDARHQPSALV
ncbi:MAG: hypothetical protein KCHDKBKB_01432 [Elusimicrobia bacterium]|nr:hypothetical protein [Elusimicrobiota bacterium]